MTSIGICDRCGGEIRLYEKGNGLLCGQCPNCHYWQNERFGLNNEPVEEVGENSNPFEDCKKILWVWEDKDGWVAKDCDCINRRGDDEEWYCAYGNKWLYLDSDIDPNHPTKEYAETIASTLAYCEMYLASIVKTGGTLSYPNDAKSIAEKCYLGALSVSNRLLIAECEELRTTARFVKDASDVDASDFDRSVAIIRKKIAESYEVQ